MGMNAVADRAAPGRPDSVGGGETARIVELDALRGIAAIVIVLHHFHGPIFGGWGFVGVNLFFVLSGFLITGIIIGQHTRPGFYRVFYARRALRILPIYYLTLFAMMGVNALLGSPRSAWKLVPFLTFTQNIQGYVPGFVTTGVAAPWPMLEHFWTLACEEHFYLIWPPLVCLLGPRLVIPSALILTVIGVAARGYFESLWILLTNLDGFALGAILAAMLPTLQGQDRRSSRTRWWVFGVALLTFASFPVWGRGLSRAFRIVFDSPIPNRAIFGLVLFCLNLAMFTLIGLVVASAGRPALAFLRGRVLCYLGTISYGMYIYHPIVFWAGEGLEASVGAGPTWAWFAAKLAATVAIASLSWHLIERPILSLKSRFRYR